MPKCDIIFNLGKDYSSELEEDKIYVIKAALDKDTLSDYPLQDVAEFLTGRVEEVDNILNQINGFFRKQFVSKQTGIANCSLQVLTENIPVEGGWNKEFEELPEFKSHNILYMDTESPNDKSFFTDRQSGIIIIYRNGLSNYKGHLESKILLSRLDVSEENISPDLRITLDYYRRKENKPDLTLKQLLNDFLSNSEYIYNSEYAEGLDPIQVLEDETNNILKKPENFKYATYELTALSKRIESRKRGKHWITVPSIIKILKLDDSELKEIDTTTDKGRQEYRRKLKKLVDEKIEFDKDFPYKFSSVEFDEEDHDPTSVTFNKVGRDSIGKLYKMEYEDCYLNFTHIQTYKGYRIYMRKIGNQNRYYYTKELIHPDLWLSRPYNTEESIKLAIDEESEKEPINEGNIILNRSVGKNLIYISGAASVKPGYTFRVAEIQESTSSSIWKRDFYNSTVKDLKEELERLKKQMIIKYNDFDILVKDLNDIINLIPLVDDPNTEITEDTLKQEILKFKRTYINLFSHRFVYIQDKVENILDNIDQYYSNEGSYENLEDIKILFNELKSFNIKEKYNEVLEYIQQIRNSLQKLRNLDEKRDINGNLLTDEQKLQIIKDIWSEIDSWFIYLQDYIPIKNLHKISGIILRSDNLAKANTNIKDFIKQLNNIFSDNLFTNPDQIDEILPLIQDKDSALAFINLISNLQYSYDLEGEMQSEVINKLKNITYTYYEVIEQIGGKNSRSCVVMPVKPDAITRKLKTKTQISEGKYDSINKRQFINNLSEWIGKLVEGSGFEVKILTEDEINNQFKGMNYQYASGFVSGNYIIINSSRSNLTTPLHEYIHIFFGIFKALNPQKFYEFLDNIVENNSTKKGIKYQLDNLSKMPRYRGMAYYDLVEEAFAEVYVDKIIRNNKKVFGEEFKLSIEPDLKQKFKDIFDNIDKTKNLNLEEILKLPLFKLTDLISVLKDSAIEEEEEKEREKIIKEINEKAKKRRIKTNIIKDKIQNHEIIENCKS